jgi:hypothetical protein
MATSKFRRSGSADFTLKRYVHLLDGEFGPGLDIEAETSSGNGSHGNEWERQSAGQPRSGFIEGYAGSRRHATERRLLLPKPKVAGSKPVVRSQPAHVPRPMLYGTDCYRRGHAVARKVIPSPYARPDAEGIEVAMEEHNDSRGVAVERLEAAREQRARSSEQYEAASGSSRELPAFTELQAAEDQFAAREAWLKWVDRAY